MKKINLQNQSFGKWLVLEDDGTRTKYKGIKWKCLCDCGNIGYVPTHDLLINKSTQCKNCRSIQIATKHGYSKTKEYHAYQGMFRRCYSPDYQGYEHYGGRGIQVNFTSFEEFIEEIGNAPSPEYTLDRINSNGHYEKGNIKWSTWKEQRGNRR